MTSTLMVFPFTIIFLFSQSFSLSSSSSIFQTLSYRIYALFHAAGFPASFQFFSLLNLKLSQTIFSYLFCLPFTLTFFLLSKAITIHMMQHELMLNSKTAIPSTASLFQLYKLLLPTHVFNSLAVLSANAAVFSLLFIVFNTFEILGMYSENHILGLSASSAVFYSIVLANTTVICSLAMVISALENCRGCIPFLKGCILIQGKEATAITATLPASMAMAAVEALFQYRVSKPYIRTGMFTASAASEYFLIAYMYSILTVFDTIVSSVMYKSIKEDRSFQVERERKSDLEA